MKQKIYKLLSIMLTLAVILSTCICAVGTVSAADATYYVSADGSDDNDGSTASAPVKTIKKAIELANESYGSEDTVVIKTVGAGAITSGHAAKASLPTYEFKKLVITANDTTVPGTISGDMQLGGETEFSYITVASQGNENNGNGFTFAGYSATFGENAYLGALGSPNNTTLSWNSGAKTSTAPINVKINQINYNSFYLSGNSYNWTTYNHPITVEIDNWNAQYRNEVNGGFIISHNSGITLDAPLNLKVDQSNIRLVFKANTAKTTYGDNFALQVINATGKAVAKTGDTLTRGDSVTAVHTSALDAMPEGKVYILNNNTGSKSAVEFTDTVGKYKVNLNPELFKIRAKAEGKEDVLSENGFLNLTAGEWTLTIEKESNLVATYYVSPEGSDDADGKTINTPLASVEKAVQLANEVGYGVGDTVYIKVIHVANKATVWTTNSGDKISSHAFTLDISSNGDIATLGTSNKTLFNGPTNLSNVKLAWGSGYPAIDLGGNDVIFGEGVSTTSIDYDLCYAFNGTLDNEHNLTFKGNYNKDLNLGGTWANRPTINGTVNVTYDGSAGYTFRIANRQGDNVIGAHATKINGTLNINLKSAAFVNLNFVNNIAQVRYGENSVVQVINSIGADSTAWDNALSTNNVLAKPSKYYILDNNIGWSNAVEFTDTAGKFKVNVDTERFNILANNKLVEVTEGYATFEPGKYTLTLEVKNPFNDTYFVKTGATGGNGEEATPFATVAEAIAAANAKGSVYGDNITIKLVGEETVVWGETEEFTFVPVVESANKEDVTTLAINAALQGNVVFDYVAIDSSGAGYKRLYVDGNSVKFGANVYGNIEFVAAQQAANYKNGQTVEINSTAVKNIYVGNTSQNNNSFSGDVNYIINNDNLITKFNFMPTYGHKIDINGNLRIKVVAAKSITIGDTTIENSGSVMAGRVNIIGATNGASLIAPIDTTLVNLDNFKNINGKYYILKVAEGIDIDGTEYADEYNVAFDEITYNLVVTDAEGNTNQATYGSGILTLDNPGEYTVKLKCKDCIYDRECDTTCDRCGAVDETRKHKFTAYTFNTGAECDKNATEKAYCDYGCGKTDIRDIAGTKLDHTYENYVSNNDATCTANGTETGTCVCGAKDTRVVANSKKAHTSDKGTVTKKATCTATGIKTYKCTVCKTTLKSETVAKIAHSYKTTTTKATTSKNGKIVNACSVCGKVYSTKTIYYAKKVKLSTTEYTYSSSKTRKPSVKVYDYKGNKISSSYYDVSYASGRKKVGKYKVTIKLKGNYSGTLTAYFTINPKIKLSTTEYTYNGKAKKPTVKVTDSSGKKISTKYYTVSYSSGRKKVGKYTVTIKFKNGHSGTYKKTFTIVPKESKVSSISAAKKSLKVKISKVSSQATGYEIQYSTSSKFSSKYTKTKKVTSYKTTSVTLKSLKAKKTYYVRVRTYKTVDGKKYYSDWSSKKSKKTK